MDDFLNSVADEIDAASKRNQATSSEISSTSKNIGELLRQASNDESGRHLENEGEDDYNDPFEEDPKNLTEENVKKILQKSAKVVAMEDAIDGKYNLRDAVNEVSESLQAISNDVTQNSDRYSDNGEEEYVDDDDDHNVQTKKGKLAMESDSESEIAETPEEDETNFDYPEHQDFIFSCYHHKYDAVEHHLDRGASIFYADRHGWTALHWSCAKGYDDLVHLLLRDLPESKKKRYLHMKEKTAGMTPLHVRPFSFS